MKVFVESSQKEFKKLEKEAANAAAKVLKALKKEATLEIYLVSNAEMKVLNKKFRGKNKVTNVLSFGEYGDFPHPELGKSSAAKIGEIYLAPDYIAAKKENPTKLVIHGVLHLLGYDHKTRNDSIIMERLEAKLFSRTF